jgi:hypothetical protein
LLVAPLSTAHAQSAEAEVLFRDGRALIKKGKLEPGCDKLAASERLESSVGTLLNLGDCREKLGKLASAWAAFRKAEALAKRTGGDDKRMAEASRRAAALEPRLATLVIDVPNRVDGLTVRRDGETIDSAGWSTPLPVDPATYTVIAEAPGYLPWRGQVTVAPGAKKQIVAVPALEPAPAVGVASTWPPPQATVRAAPPARGTWSTTRKFSIAVAAVGAGAVGAGVYFGLHANTLQDRANQRCPLTLCADPEGLKLNDDAQRSATRANILYLAGGATIAAAAVMWFVGAPGETVIAPSAGNGQYGVSMTGSF